MCKKFKHLSSYLLLSETPKLQEKLPVLQRTSGFSKHKSFYFFVAFFGFL
jgi:hypothetical protein